MIEVLEGDLLARMFIHASAALNKEKQVINELNVFPVPDGDTGTNMSLTIGTAAAELRKQEAKTVGEVTGITANAMLRGARGNSGVILSLLIRGFAKTVKDMETIDGTVFASALSAGVAAAYKAVMKPAEGTVLTVSRVSAQRAQEAAEENPAVEYVLEETIRAGEQALGETVEQNPVLKKAGVVDAGGMGYVIILQGMLDALRGLPMPEIGEEETDSKQANVFQSFSSEEIAFGYCTEFICSRDTDKDPEKMRSFLSELGDSLVLVDDDEIIKVHVHTNHPGKVLEEALSYGALLTVKIENMREQHSEILETGAEEADVMAEPEKKYGFVVVCAGSGLRKVFEELGADGFISGGQTMNPSTEDILREINRTPSEIVFVLPNNKNIIMAAQQAKELVENKKVVVLPTATVPQGISAMLNMDFEATESENIAAMEAALTQVTTLEVTYAARNSEFDGVAIKEGDYLALKDNGLFATDANLDQLLEKMAEGAAQQAAEFINVFYGEGVEKEAAQKAADAFQAACPDAEVTLLEGGQPVYAYLISVE